MKQRMARPMLASRRQLTVERWVANSISLAVLLAVATKLLGLW